MNSGPEWQILEAAEKEDFINSVKDSAYPELFDPPYSRVQCFPLSFYKNGYLYLLENLKNEPPFTLVYLRSGDNFAYLDGSSASFEHLNGLSLLQLNAQTVIDYLHIYCFYVIQPHVHIMLLKDPDDMPFQDSYFIDFHFDKNNYTEDDIKVSRNENDDGFIINAPFTFAGKIDPATAYIDDDGTVQIEKAER